MVEIDVHADDAGQRADRFLRKLLAAAPLGLIHRLLRQGAVRVDGRALRGADRLPAGAVVELRVDAGRFAELRGARARGAPARTPRVPPLRVLHEDDDVLVVDKPGGLAVHGGTGVGDDHLAARLAARGERGTLFRPAPAHRIDRGTSGLVAIGTSGRGLRGLTAAFREHRVTKVYLAVVHGFPTPPEGTIDVPLDAADGDGGRGRKSVAAADGRRAVSHYRVLRSARGLSLVEVRIETGRTHQVRAHLAHFGHPLVGDRRYGAPDDGLLAARHRFALHAARLVFPHPADGRQVKVESPLPDEFAALLGG